MGRWPFPIDPGGHTFRRKAMNSFHNCKSLRSLGLALFSLAVPSLCPAQQAAAPAAQETSQQPLPVAPVIKKESRLVLVDAVVTDKKGNYVHDLTQNDFKVFEDNKEQTVTSFSTGANAAGRQNSQKHYMILFFDNSSMAPPDQI